MRETWDLLASHRVEVVEVILMEYDEEKYRELEQKKYLKEGETCGKGKIHS